MKRKATLFFASLVLSSGMLVANETDDCATSLSLFAEAAKSKNYDAAMPHLEELLENCASFSMATYQYGERIYKHRIENAPEEEKMKEYEAYKALYEKRLENFPDRTTKGEMLADLSQVMYDNKICSKMEQYKAFERAYEEDKENFTSPKAIYTYFSLGVDLLETEEVELQEVFDLYDELIKKIEDEENGLAERITPLVEKQEAGESVSAKEERLMKAGETNLKAYAQVKSSVNGKLGNIADCSNLIPLYEKDFEDKKEDIDWLNNVNTRLANKECTDAPIFFKVSEALHEADPSAASAYSLGILAEADGKANVALDYYNQSAELETNPGKKANTYYKIAENYRKKGSLSNARDFYRKAIDAKPSYGRAYLQIATMYANSSNDCGENVFEKRAINWLAADLARTAARLDPSVKGNAEAAIESYMQRAPSKKEIFEEGMEGKSVTFKCWVGSSVKVPNL